MLAHRLTLALALYFLLPVGPPASAQAICAADLPAAAQSCLAQHYADVDRLMAAAYKAALARSEASGLGKNLIMDWKRALQEAQRKWLAFREADCGPPIAYEQASTPASRDTAQMRCRIAHTEARLAALRSRYPS